MEIYLIILGIILFLVLFFRGTKLTTSDEGPELPMPPVLKKREKKARVPLNTLGQYLEEVRAQQLEESKPPKLVAKERTETPFGIVDKEVLRLIGDSVARMEITPQDQEKNPTYDEEALMNMNAQQLRDAQNNFDIDPHFKPYRSQIKVSKRAAKANSNQVRKNIIMKEIFGRKF